MATWARLPPSLLGDVCLLVRGRLLTAWLSPKRWLSRKPRIPTSMPYVQGWHMKTHSTPSNM